MFACLSISISISNSGQMTHSESDQPWLKPYLLAQCLLVLSVCKDPFSVGDRVRRTLRGTLLEIRLPGTRQISCRDSIQSLQLCILHLRLLQDGDVRFSVFPEREEILIGLLGFGGVALHRIGSADLEMRECADRVVEHNSAMAEDFLEFGGGFAALMGGQIGFSSNKNGI
jgi:hypothetical protein